MYGEKMVEVKNLTKRFGRLTALDGVSFDVFKGEIFGLLGPNAAGKSTFISILTTILKPSSGDILIDGVSVARHADRVKGNIGFVPQDIALYPMLSGMDNLNFWAGIYGLRGSVKKERINEALGIVGLKDRARDRVEEYSGGMKRRLNIAVALLHHPGLLVMDEPTVGVDIQSRRLIFEAMKNLKASGTTIIFTSHYIDEMEYSCDRLAVINKGAVCATGAPEEIKSAAAKERLEDVLLEVIGDGE